MLSAVRSFSTSAAAAANVKIAAKDSASALSTVSVIVNNAGSRNTKRTGLAHLLAKSSFLNTTTKSALRFTRESELLGGQYSSAVTRDAIVLQTTFLKQDLPYYVEALGNVVAQTQFRPHELTEIALPVALAEYESAKSSNAFVALEKLHELSFRRGLGNPLYYDGANKFTSEDIQQYASKVFTAGNIEIRSTGVVEADLAKFVGESAFADLSGAKSTLAATSFHHGKEARIRAAGESVALLGVPVKAADFAKYELLSAALGNSTLNSGYTPLSKIPGATSFLHKYQDAGLFVVSVQNADAAVVADRIKQAKFAIESWATADLSSAVKTAELSLALQGVELDVASAASAKPELPEFNYVAVGNEDVLPFADEL